MLLHAPLLAPLWASCRRRRLTPVECAPQKFRTKLTTQKHKTTAPLFTPTRFLPAVAVTLKSSSWKGSFLSPKVSGQLQVHRRCVNETIAGCGICRCLKTKLKWSPHRRSNAATGTSTGRLAHPQGSYPVHIDWHGRFRVSAAQPCLSSALV